MRRSDVDLDSRKIRIEQTVTLIGGTKTAIGGTKTPKCRGTVAISPTLRNVLRMWKDTIAFKRRTADELWEEFDLVFPTARAHRATGNVIRAFDDLVTESGIPRIRVNDIRHTSATLAFECGAPLLAVPKRLGHARPSTTSDMYGHVTEAWKTRPRWPLQGPYTDSWLAPTPVDKQDSDSLRWVEAVSDGGISGSTESEHE